MQVMGTPEKRDSHTLTSRCHHCSSFAFFCRWSTPGNTDSKQELLLSEETTFHGMHPSLLPSAVWSINSEMFLGTVVVALAVGWALSAV